MSTLQDLVHALGSLVTVRAAPAGLDVAFQRIVVYDALEVPSFAPTDLVLAVGVPVESGFALRTVQARPAALLLRHDGDLDQRLVAEAMGCRVAVLTAPRSCSWSQLHEVVLSLPSREPLPATTTELLQDLFSMANALAEQVDAPVTVEDNQSRLLAYSARHEGADEARSATILGHRVPHAYRQEVRRLGIAKRLLTETEPFHLVSALPDISNRMVVAVRARDEVLGSVWALADEPFDAARTAAFGAAARSIAARLLHQRLIASLQGQHLTAVLATLLDGGATGPETARAAGLTAGAYRLLALGAREGDQPQVERLDRCGRALSMHLSLSASPGITARLGDTLYCLVAAQDAASARDVVESVRKQLTGLVVGISGHIGALEDVPSARDEVDRILQVLRSSGVQVAELGEVALPVTLHRIAQLQAARPSSSGRDLDTIEAYDVQHGTGYLETLTVFLANFGDPGLVSRELGVHTNTLRYRLKRIAEVFDVDLASDDVRFRLMLELRLR